MGTGYCDNEIEHVCNPQVADKLARGELPLVEYRVFSDPGGIRTGDGGATLHIVSELHSELGDSLFERKVLLIHSGGYSKRMPSHSCTSKIFRDPKVMKLTSSGIFFRGTLLFSY